MKYGEYSKKEQEKENIQQWDVTDGEMEIDSNKLKASRSVTTIEGFGTGRQEIVPSVSASILTVLSPTRRILFENCVTSLKQLPKKQWKNVTAIAL